MVDFHTHILPNVDDGSKSNEETLHMIEEAQKAGFDKIVCTSHYIENYYEVNKECRQAYIEEISEKLKEKKEDINLYLGNEVYISENIVQLLENNSICTINNSSYLLFELPLSAKPINLYDAIYDMLQYKLVPILAHPERYSFIQQEPELVFELIEKGVLMQSNYGSFVGQYGKKAQIIAKKMLKNDMIHFLGTDVHRKNTIYYKIPEILIKLEKWVGKDKLYKLSTINPNLVLEDKEVEIPKTEQMKFSLREKIICGLI